MTTEADLWADLRKAWAEWMASPEDWRPQLPVEAAIQAWRERDRHRPVAWVRERIAAGERPARWTSYGPRDWGGLFERDDDPCADLIDAVDLDHTELEPHELARLVLRAPQIRELALIEANLLPAAAALFAPDVRWSALEVLHLEDSVGDDDLRAIARAHLPALRELTVLSEEPLSSADAQLASASWWSGLRALMLGAGPEDVVLAMAAADMPALETLELTDPTDAVTAAWRDPARRPRLR